MKKGIVWIIGVMIFLGLFACSGKSSSTSNTTNTATYSISGTITLSGTGLQGVAVALNSSATATTDASGNYSFTGLANGTYTVTPSKTGYTFNPTSSTQTVSSANIPGVNFTATSTGTATGSDFVGTWNGNNVLVTVNTNTFTTASTLLTLNSALTGSYKLNTPGTGKGSLTYLNITGSVAAGTITFSLPVDEEDVGQPCPSGGPVWGCSGALSNNKSILTLSCSGTTCQSESISWTDVMTK